MKWPMVKTFDVDNDLILVLPITEFVMFLNDIMSWSVVEH